MNHNEQQKNVRTPYPRISFERAYNYLLKIRAAYPTTSSLSKTQIVQALGFSSTSGTAHTALGALSHYGFAYKTGIQQNLRYHLTDLALKLIGAQGSSTWTALALKSATLPETFSFLRSYHEYGHLPDDIESQLIGRYDEVNTKNVNDVIKLFYDSMNFISRDLPVELELSESSSPQEQYKVSLGNGMVVSATEEVIAKALKYYLKNFEID